MRLCIWCHSGHVEGPKWRNSFSSIARSSELHSTHQPLMYVFSLYIDYWLGLCQLWDFFNWSTVKVYVERMLVNIIPIQLQRLTPVLLSLITRKTNKQTNFFFNLSNRLQPSTTEVKKSINIPQFSARSSRCCGCPLCCVAQFARVINCGRATSLEARETQTWTWSPHLDRAFMRVAYE